MKNFKLYYLKESGLTQVGPISAHSYLMKDGFFCFYSSEDHKTRDESFKVINKCVVAYLCEE